MFLNTIYYKTIIFHMLIDLGKDMTHIDFDFTRLSGQCHKGHFCKRKQKKVSCHYLKNCSSQNFHISHADMTPIDIELRRTKVKVRLITFVNYGFPSIDFMFFR